MGLDSSHNINQTNPETLPTTQQTPHHHQYGQQMDYHSTLITPEQQMYTGEPYNIPDTYNNHYYQPPYYHQYQYETNYTPENLTTYPTLITTTTTNHHTTINTNTKPTIH